MAQHSITSLQSGSGYLRAVLACFCRQSGTGGSRHSAKSSSSNTTSTAATSAQRPPIARFLPSLRNQAGSLTKQPSPTASTGDSSGGPDPPVCGHSLAHGQPPLPLVVPLPVVNPLPVLTPPATGHAMLAGLFSWLTSSNTTTVTQFLSSCGQEQNKKWVEIDVPVLNAKVLVCVQIRELAVLTAAISRLTQTGQPRWST